MIPCPSCDRSWAGEVSLASHLITAHGLAAPAAVERARQTVRDAERRDRRVIKKGRGRAMAKNKDRTGECSECHGLRHQKGCSQHFKAKQQKAPAPQAGAKKHTPITRRHPMKPRTSGGSKDARGPVRLTSELEALHEIAVALEPLGPVERGHVLACICKLLAIDPAKLAA